jgi:hypothetical protein
MSSGGGGGRSVVVVFVIDFSPICSLGSRSAFLGADCLSLVSGSVIP